DIRVDNSDGVPVFEKTASPWIDTNGVCEIQTPSGEYRLRVNSYDLKWTVGIDSDESTGRHAGQPVPPIELTALALFDTYEANEVAADHEYAGRILRVTGSVRSIQNGITGNPYIVLNTRQDLFGVQALYRTNRAYHVERLQKGDSETVDCQPAGK